jgi:hypothetical protein
VATLGQKDIINLSRNTTFGVHTRSSKKVFKNM